MADHLRACVEHEWVSSWLAEPGSTSRKQRLDPNGPLVSGVVSRGPSEPSHDVSPQSADPQADATLDTEQAPTIVASIPGFEGISRASELDGEPIGTTPTALCAARLEIVEIPPLPSVRGFAELLRSDGEEQETVLSWLDGKTKSA